LSEIGVRLLQLSTHCFRNLQPAELQCGSRFNVFHGANGQGKTNLLEAIYLLGTLKSFRHARNREMIRSEAEHAVVRGILEKDRVTRDVTVEMDLRIKHPRLDGNPIERLGDFFGHLNVVLFAPDDLLMLKGSPELRRRYLDRAVFSVDLAYLRCYHDYHRTLKNRNALLKSGDLRGLEAWNVQLVITGTVLAARRAAYIARSAPLVRDYYRTLAGKHEEVTQRYDSLLIGEDGQLRDDAAELFASALAKTAREELRRGSSLTGPHRDDLQFRLNGRDVRQYASQGQLRSLILAMKMAEITVAEEQFGAPPILLLDDLASELDQERTANMLAFLDSRPIQVFITTTDPTAIPFAAGTDLQRFRVANGSVQQ
jgi:DNA replication and repair protein RecF